MTTDEALRRRAVIDAMAPLLGPDVDAGHAARRRHAISRSPRGFARAACGVAARRPRRTRAGVPSRERRSHRAHGRRRSRMRSRTGRLSAARGGRSDARAHRGASTVASAPSRRHGGARPREGRRARCGARGRARSGRSPACPSRSRTCSTSRASPTLAGSKINREQSARRRATRRWSSVSRRPARSASARSTWANMPMISPARTSTTGPRAIRTTSTRMSGGSSGGSGSGGRGRLRAAGARLRHQRLDPRARLALRPVRPEADLWPAVAAARTFPFVASLDHLGPLARSVADLALAYDAMQGADPRDPACAPARRRAGVAD